MRSASKMKLKYLIPLIGFLAMAVLLGIGLTLDPKAVPSTMIGKTAPAFDLPLLDDRKQNFAPKDLTGKRWILNVWASWCVSCRYEHPILNELAASGAVPIVGLNYKDTDPEAIQWLAERGNPYVATPADNKGSAGIEWGVIAVPETFIIDETGTVIYKHSGPITRELVAKEMWPLITAPANPAIQSP